MLHRNMNHHVAICAWWWFPSKRMAGRDEVGKEHADRLGTYSCRRSRRSDSSDPKRTRKVEW